MIQILTEDRRPAVCNPALEALSHLAGSINPDIFEKDLDRVMQIIGQDGIYIFYIYDPTDSRRQDFNADLIFKLYARIWLQMGERFARYHQTVLRFGFQQLQRDIGNVFPNGISQEELLECMQLCR